VVWPVLVEFRDEYGGVTRMERDGTATVVKSPKRESPGGTEHERTGSSTEIEFDPPAYLGRGVSQLGD
jgi:hypothetical protein